MILVLINLSTWLKCTKFKKNKIQKLPLEEIENLDRSLTTKEVKSVVKNLMVKGPASYCFIGKFYRYSRNG